MYLGDNIVMKKTQRGACTACERFEIWRVGEPVERDHLSDIVREHSFAPRIAQRAEVLQFMLKLCVLVHVHCDSHYIGNAAMPHNEAPLLSPGW